MKARAKVHRRSTSRANWAARAQEQRIRAACCQISGLAEEELEQHVQGIMRLVRHTVPR